MTLAGVGGGGGGGAGPETARLVTDARYGERQERAKSSPSASLFAFDDVLADLLLFCKLRSEGGHLKAQLLQLIHLIRQDRLKLL